MCSVFFFFLFLLGQKRLAKEESTINMLIYAATSSFHYAYNHHWSRVCSPLFLMYQSHSCVAQGQNQQSTVDLCSFWFPAAIVHQGRILTLFMRQKWLLLWLWLISRSPLVATAAAISCLLPSTLFWSLAATFAQRCQNPPFRGSQTVRLWLMLSCVQPILVNTILKRKNFHVSDCDTKFIF